LVPFDQINNDEQGDLITFDCVFLLTLSEYLIRSYHFTKAETSAKANRVFVRFGKNTQGSVNRVNMCEQE